MVLIGAIVAATAVNVAPNLSTDARSAVSLAIMAIVLLTWPAVRSHDRRLCARCAKAMPLDAPSVAARYPRRFTVAHLGERKLLAVGYLGVLVVADVVLLTMPSAIGRLLWCLVQTSLVYLVLAYDTHRRFQPWCPYCSSGGGGTEHVDAPTPVGPTGVGV